MFAAAIERDTLPGVYAPKVVSSEAQNERYISVLLELERKPKLTAREKSYAQILTVLIEDFEDRKYPIRKASPVEVLSELLLANNLRQKDLAPLLGSESVVSEVLSGRRGLNKSHIEKLSKRFKVSPAVFF
jgi:HTH-type transcriptional regulator / antitoxin HigA